MAKFLSHFGHLNGSSNSDYQIGMFSRTNFLIAAFAADSVVASVISCGQLFQSCTLGYWKLDSLNLDLKADLSLILLGSKGIEEFIPKNSLGKKIFLANGQNLPFH